MDFAYGIAGVSNTVCACGRAAAFKQLNPGEPVPAVVAKLGPCRGRPRTAGLPPADDLAARVLDIVDRARIAILSATTKTLCVSAPLREPFFSRRDRGGTQRRRGFGGEHGARKRHKRRAFAVKLSLLSL
jgi:hypothetical protein